MHGEACSVDRFDSAHCIALNARNLHKAANRVTGQSQVVFHADFGRFFDMIVRAA